MTNIIIDLGGLNSQELSMSSTGIKLFLHKKKGLHLHIIGDATQLLTLKDTSEVTIFDTAGISVKSLSKSDIISSKSLAYSCALLDREENNTLVTFASKHDVSLAMESTRRKIINSPLFVAAFPNAYTGKKTLLGDLGYKPYPSDEDYRKYIECMTAYLKSTADIDNPTCKLLLPSGLIKTDDMKKTASFLRENSSYVGEIGTNDMLEADCDILIGDPGLIQATISGINQGVTIFNEYLNNGMNTSFQFKFGGIFMRKLIDSFNASVDKKITSGGTSLLGFDKNVVLVRKDTTANGVSACIDLAYRSSQAKYPSK